MQSTEEILETLRQGRLAHPQYVADALAAERDRADRADARLAEARKQIADFEATA